MRCVKSIFTVSIFAMIIVSGARAEIVSKTQLDKTIVAGTNVTIDKPTSGANNGKIVINATDTNTTYTTGTESYSGTTKLYGSTGTSTDGTMTRGAITTALSGKQPTLTTTNLKGAGSVSVGIANGVVTITGTDTQYTLPDATADVKGGVRVMTSAAGIDESSAAEDAKVPTVAAAWDIANTAAGNNSVGRSQGETNKNKILITGATGDVAPVAVTTTGSGNAVTSVSVAGGKYTVTKGTTFATKAQLDALDSATTGTGAVVTNVAQTDGKVTVTKGNVQVPVGSSTATTYAAIWVE